jgi:hypothetical protein
MGKSLEATRKFRKTKKGVLTNSYGHQKQRRNVEYTLKELHEKFLHDKKFNRIYEEWVNSGYDLQFKPTIDRINCKKTYTIENIQILSWSENRYKQRMELKLIRAKPIAMLKGDVVVEKFKSVSDAVRKTGLSQGNISSCLTGKRKTCDGYMWRYVIGNIHESED